MPTWLAIQCVLATTPNVPAISGRVVNMQSSPLPGVRANVAAMQLATKTYDVADIHAAQELYHANGWTDGLPIVPPTQDAVHACLDWAMTPPDQLLGIEPVRGVPITAEKLAINAVMAGCLPMHFPAVLTAFTAMLQPEFLLHGATASTGGCAVLVVLNGPIRRELGAAGTFNALGNSDRATAVIGRAIRLALINILEVRPGGIDRSTLGHPGKFSYCVAEDEEDTAWLPLHVQRGLPRGGLRRHRHGGRRAAPDHERVDHAPGGDPGDLRRRDARQHAALFDLGRQLCADHPQAAARTSAGRRLEQDRRRRLHPRARPRPPRRMGRGRQGAPWCATGATPNTPRWSRPISCWSSRPAVPPAGSAR